MKPLHEIILTSQENIIIMESTLYSEKSTCFEMGWVLKTYSVSINLLCGWLHQIECGVHFLRTTFKDHLLTRNPWMWLPWKTESILLFGAHCIIGLTVCAFWDSIPGHGLMLIIRIQCESDISYAEDLNIGIREAGNGVTLQSSDHLVTILYIKEQSVDFGRSSDSPSAKHYPILQA